MTVADFITRQKGRRQVVFSPMRCETLVPERTAQRVDGLERSRALLKAAEIVLIHFPGDGEEWTLRDDNRTVELEDGTAFQIGDYQ